MITGGDEIYRTQRCNNNTYNLDSTGNWIDWSGLAANQPFYAFARRLIRFRNAHPALRRLDFFRGADGNGDGVKDITWYRADGAEANAAYFESDSGRFLAYRIDGTEAAGDPADGLLVAYNLNNAAVTVTLPSPRPGRRWHRVADTAAWLEPEGNAHEAGSEPALTGPSYGMHGRSLLLLIEK